MPLIDVLGEMTELEDAVKRCIPLLASDPLLIKCDFNTTAIKLLDVEYDQVADRKLVILEPCGMLSPYIGEILRELLSEEEHIDAHITFHY